MPVRRRHSKQRAELTEGARDWLAGGDGGIEFRFFTEPELKALLWSDYGATAVENWVAEHPGSRPNRWWEHDAPEPRQRLGGHGRLLCEVMAYKPTSAFGIPTGWHEIDADDPPIFESEAAYLKRLGLFLPGEARRLKPADFEPVVVVIE